MRPFFNHTIDLSLTQCVTTRLLSVILSSLHKNFSRPTMMMVCTMCEIWFLMLRQEVFLAKEKILNPLLFVLCKKKMWHAIFIIAKGWKLQSHDQRVIMDDVINRKLLDISIESLIYWCITNFDARSFYYLK